MSQIRYAAGLLCLVLLAGAACGGEPAPPPRRPAGTSSQPPPSSAPTSVRKPTDGGGKPSTTRSVVPDVVCKDLQTAQDTLQAAGFYNLGSEDATGQGRQQLVDRNWVVVKQSAPPGSKPEPLTRIMLSAVKFGEPTGPSACQS